MQLWRRRTKLFKEIKDKIAHEDEIKKQHEEKQQNEEDIFNEFRAYIEDDKIKTEIEKGNNIKEELLRKKREIEFTDEHNRLMYVLTHSFLYT